MRSLFRKIREANRPFCTALVAAAGSSSRMGGTDKLMEFLDNVPVLMRTLTALQRAAAIDEIVIAAREDALVDISTLCKTYGITKCSKVVRGGESRCHSVLLAALEASPEAKLLAVQDGARPLVTPALIDRTVEAAAKCGAAAPAVPVKDTIKTVAEDGAVTGTPDRSTLRAVQTPQVFEADLLKAALQSALENEVPVTDDCSAVERLGKVVYLIDGDEENLKITTPVDLVIAEGACTNSNWMEMYRLGGTFAPIADWELLSRAAAVAKEQGTPVVVGNVLSEDQFYNDDPDYNKAWMKMGVLCLEMETAALYCEAARCGKQALSVLTVSDEILTGKQLSSKERETGFRKMMELALELA